MRNKLKINAHVFYACENDEGVIVVSIGVLPIRYHIHVHVY